MDKYKLYDNALARKGQDWFKVNIIMVGKLGIKEAITIRRYLEAQDYFASKNQLTSDGYFFSTYDDISKTTGLSRKQVIAAVKQLEGKWLYMDDKKKNYHKYYHEHIEEGMKEKEAEKQAEIDCENEFIALVKQLNEDIEKVKNDETLKDEEKNKQIVKLKKDAGYKRLLDTDISILNDVKRKWFKVNRDVYDEFLKDGNGIICSNVEDEKYWIVYNKKMALKYGPITTIIFSDIYSTYMNAKAEGTLIENIWIKAPQGKLAKKIGVSRQTVVNYYMLLLKETNLIDCITMGWNNSTHITIREDELDKVLDINEMIESTKEETDVERITRTIIEKAKDYGEDWHYKFYEYASYIEERLEEGLTEDELISLVDYVHDYYCIPKNQRYYKTNFNFKYIYGKGRCKKQWLSMKKGEEATRRILFKVQQITNNQFIWEINEKKVNLVRNRLDNGIKEKDIIDFIESRYLYLKENDCKYTNFTLEKLLADENEKKIKAFIHSKNKANKKGNRSIRDNVESKPFTQESKDFMKKMVEIDEVY